MGMLCLALCFINSQWVKGLGCALNSENIRYGGNSGPQDGCPKLSIFKSIHLHVLSNCKITRTLLIN